MFHFLFKNVLHVRRKGICKNYKNGGEINKKMMNFSHSTGFVLATHWL